MTENSSLDLGPTLLAQASLQAFHRMQGYDASELLGNTAAKIRDEIFIEEDQLNDILHVGSPLRMRTLITEGGRLTVYQNDDGSQLFDVKNDPLEMENLTGPSALRAEMNERLINALVANADVSPKLTAFA